MQVKLTRAAAAAAPIRPPTIAPILVIFVREVGIEVVLIDLNDLFRSAEVGWIDQCSEALAIYRFYCNLCLEFHREWS